MKLIKIICIIGIIEIIVGKNNLFLLLYCLILYKYLFVIDVLCSKCIFLSVFLNVFGICEIWVSDDDNIVLVNEIGEILY